MDYSYRNRFFRDAYGVRFSQAQKKEELAGVFAAPLLSRFLHWWSKAYRWTLNFDRVDPFTAARSGL
jgi:hypothetical protein